MQAQSEFGGDLLMSIFGSIDHPNVVDLKSKGDVEGLIEALNYET
jgi:hypothetical protein